MFNPEKLLGGLLMGGSRRRSGLGSLAGRMLQAFPQKGGGKGEGSILGSLGGLLDGDG